MVHTVYQIQVAAPGVVHVFLRFGNESVVTYPAPKGRMKDIEMSHPNKMIWDDMGCLHMFTINMCKFSTGDLHGFTIHSMGFMGFMG